MKNETIFYLTCASLLGTLLVARSEKGLCAIFIGDDLASLVADLERRFSGKTHRLHACESDVALQTYAIQLVSQIETPNRDFYLDGIMPIDSRGTDFQERVWQALRSIPFGQRVSYTDLAHMIDQPKSVRAVANACGANPLAVLTPCHRVIRRDGKLSGYRWGVHRKQHLLEWESRQQRHRL